MDELGKIRAQRAEVEALLGFRHSAEGQARVLAWWRLHGVRQSRIKLMTADEARWLPALPKPPDGALGSWQALRLGFGLLAIERATPPRRVARALRRA